MHTIKLCFGFLYCFLIDSYCLRCHILHTDFTGNWKIVWLPLCQLSNCEGYGWNRPLSYHNDIQQSVKHVYNSRDVLHNPAKTDCYTGLAWRLWDCQCDVSAVWLADINEVRETPWLHWILSDLRIILGSRDWWDFHYFSKALTVSLHIPNGRHLPAVRVVQWDCERIYCQEEALFTTQYWYPHMAMGTPLATDIASVAIVTWTMHYIATY